MKGRIEQKIKVLMEVDRLLEDQPEYLKKFNTSMVKSSYNTRKNYIIKIIPFINYLHDNGFDINNVKCFKKVDNLIISEYFETTQYSESVNGEMKELSHSHKYMQFFALKKFFEFLRQKKIIKINPMTDMPIPIIDNDTNVTYMTPEEVHTVEYNIIQGVSEKTRLTSEPWRIRDLAIFELGVQTGLRVSAISFINIEDIDLQNNIIRVIEKGDKIRDVIISQNTKKILIEWIRQRSILLGENNCEALFISRRNVRIHTNTIRDIIKKYTFNVNKNITPHKMRSTCGVNLYDKTKDIYMVQNVLGHRNIKTTERYTRISSEQLKEAANIMDKIYGN